MSELKFASQLTDEELTEIYKSFMCEKDKFVDLTITRCEFGIALEGHIRIPEEDPDYADEYGMCLIDEDYSIDDFRVKAYYHSGNMNPRFRKWMYKRFGTEYAEAYLFNY